MNDATLMHRIHAGQRKQGLLQRHRRVAWVRAAGLRMARARAEQRRIDGVWWRRLIAWVKGVFR